MIVHINLFNVTHFKIFFDSYISQINTFVLCYLLVCMHSTLLYFLSLFAWFDMAYIDISIDSCLRPKVQLSPLELRLWSNRSLVPKAHQGKLLTLQIKQLRKMLSRYLQHLETFWPPYGGKGSFGYIYIILPFYKIAENVKETFFCHIIVFTT